MPAGLYSPLGFCTNSLALSRGRGYSTGCAADSVIVTQGMATRFTAS